LKPKIEPDHSASSAIPTGMSDSMDAPFLATPDSRGADLLVPRSRLDAISSLLADDSPHVQAEVRKALENAGKESRPVLERAARSHDARLRARARSILSERAQRSAFRRFARYAFHPGVDLERGLFLLARLHAPRLDPRPYQRALDAMAAEVARRGSSKTDEFARAMVLAEYLGKELRFGGSRGEFHHPDNIDLHRAIERRAGIPLTLSAIWLFVARRAGIRATLVPLPGHVMLRIHAGRRSGIVDPYHEGRTRTDAECRTYLAKQGLAASSAAFRDAPDPILLRRQVANLARSAELRGRVREARNLVTLVRALEPRRASGSLTG
jgi:regulator of sirC expression with transglutaminase-like and TPR domain